MFSKFRLLPMPYLSKPILLKPLYSFVDFVKIKKNLCRKDWKTKCPVFVWSGLLCFMSIYSYANGLWSHSHSIFERPLLLNDSFCVNQRNTIEYVSSKQLLQWNAIQGFCHVVRMIENQTTAIKNHRDNQIHEGDQRLSDSDMDRDVAYRQLFHAFQMGILRNESSTITQYSSWEPHECRSWSSDEDRDTQTLALMAQNVAWLLAQPDRKNPSWRGWTDASQLLTQAGCSNVRNTFGISESSKASVWAFQPQMIPMGDSVEAMFRDAELIGDSNHIRAALAVHALYEWVAIHPNRLRIILERAEAVMTDAIESKDKHAIVLDSIGRSILIALIRQQYNQQDIQPVDLNNLEPDAKSDTNNIPHASDAGSSDAESSTEGYSSDNDLYNNENNKNDNVIKTTQ